DNNNLIFTGPGTILAGGTLEVASTGTVTFSGTLSGSGGVTIRDGGRLLVTGSNTYTGGTTVNAGTLAGTGSVGGGVVNNLGRLSPGGLTGPGYNGPGIFHTEDTALNAGSTLEIDFTGITAGSGYDQLNVTGPVTLDGPTLNVALLFDPAVGDAFTII